MTPARSAIDIAPFGPLAEPSTIVRLAREAEAAGWDGLSIWDTFGLSMGAAAPDPFVALAAVAAATRELRIITSVICLPRRRPQLVAQAVATLDRLSGGRCILGVGAGADPGDFTPFGDEFERSARMAAFDEALAAVDGYLRAAPVARPGVPPLEAGTRVGPEPVQAPRPPIWIGGMRPGALRRAAREEGWVAVATSEDGTSMALTPEAFGEMVGRLALERAALGRQGRPFDIAVFGLSGPDGRDLPSRYGAAGATWWLESLSPMRGDLEALVEVVRAGPPTA